MVYAVAAAVYLVDRVSKHLAERHLAGEPPVVLIPRVLQLRYTENPGGAFGLFGGQPWLFFLATVVVAGVIAFLSWRLAVPSSAVALGLILGGALGNLTDRIVRGPGVGGQVVDFIEFPRVWPVFNLADSAIVLGAIVVLLAGVHRRPED